MAKQLSTSKAKSLLNAMNLGAEESIRQVTVKKLRLTDGFVYYVISGDVFTLEQAAEELVEWSKSYAW
jgi:hypothetical protein